MARIWQLKVEVKVAPMKVSARLTDWEEMAVRKPRPSAGMMVDWQMKPLTEFMNWAASSPCSSLLEMSVTLSVHTASSSPCKEGEGRRLVG